MTVVSLNNFGRRIGQSHPRARLSDVDIDRIFVLRERGLSYRAIARIMHMSPSGVRSIVSGRTRAQVPERIIDLQELQEINGVENGLLRTCDVLRFFPISRSLLSKLVSGGNFPKPRKFGRMNLWEKKEVIRFLQKVGA